MKRRILVPMFLAFAAVVGLALYWGSDLGLFLDAGSLVLVPGLGSLYALALHGWRRGFAALAAAFDREAGGEDLESARAFFADLGRSYLCFAALGGVVSLIDMFKNLTERRMIGPRLALAMISFEYAAILIAVLVIPLGSSVRRRLASSAESRPVAASRPAS